MPGLAARRQREMRELACQGLDGGVLAYQLRRSAARRSLALRVDAAGQVVVNAPSCIGVDVIEAFILKTAVSRYRLHDLQAIGGWVADRYRQESA